MMALNVAGPSNSHKEAQQNAPAKPQFPEAFVVLMIVLLLPINLRS